MIDGGKHWNDVAGEGRDRREAEKRELSSSHWTHLCYGQGDSYLVVSTLTGASSSSYRQL
jgi:hypothetical protein